jgi:hypothetical protein
VCVACSAVKTSECVVVVVAAFFFGSHFGFQRFTYVI